MHRPNTKRGRRSTPHLVWALVALFAFGALVSDSDRVAERLLVEECELESVDSVDDDLEESSLSSTRRASRGCTTERITAEIAGLFDRGLLDAGARSPPA